MELIASLLLGLSVILIFIGLSIPSQPSREQERLQTYGSRPRTLAEMEMRMPFSERVALPLIRGAANVVNRFTPQRNIENLKRQLELAGNPNHWGAADFLGVRGISALVTVVIVLILTMILRTPPPQNFLFWGFGLVLGFYLPAFWLTSKIRTRQHDIQRALPDALDLLTISVEAGLGFDAAMAKVVEKADNELSRAFGRAAAEVRLGKIRREALRDMANRCDVPDMTNFIAAVIQADQLGVSLSKVLRIQSEQMRVKRRQRAEELANQAPVKMVIPLVFLVFPSILIVLLGPAVLQFTTGGGFGIK
ncbi:MAG: type II secretion system F family protein [Chloroflexi bacterium]|nr:type II secretion system F family protein [Chloroflexota bacterium]